MAWRIHSSIVRGEIDNRERGRISGCIWLAGRSDSVTLDLAGNCLRDLAGCLIRFENPRAKVSAEERIDLASTQVGTAGDMTASRKVRVFDVPLEEAMRLTKAGETPPEHMANSLYIEWFSDANGRVVIESPDYALTVSAPEWTLSPGDEQKQIAASHQAILEWLDRIDQGERTAEEDLPYDPESEKPLDEFGYEKSMRESDARTDKYIALLEKYEGHPDREKIVAREMGWEWLEEALEADERGALPPSEPMEVPPLEPNPITEGIDWIRNEEGHIHHPLQRRAFESAMSMWHFCKDRGLLGEDGDEDLREMIFEFQTTSAKLAGALNSFAYDDSNTRDGAFVVASLKRAIGYLHKSVAATEKVAEKKLLPAERLELFRTELFDIREQILALMERFRAKKF